MDFANFWFSFTMTVKFILHIDISFTVIGAYNFRNKVQCTRLLSCITALLEQRKDNYQVLEYGHYQSTKITALIPAFIQTLIEQPMNLVWIHF